MNDKSIGALRAPISFWRPFGPLDSVLQALRPCDPWSVQCNDWMLPILSFHLFKVPKIFLNWWCSLNHFKSLEIIIHLWYFRFGLSQALHWLAGEVKVQDIHPPTHYHCRPHILSYAEEVLGPSVTSLQGGPLNPWSPPSPDFWLCAFGTHPVLPVQHWQSILSHLPALPYLIWYSSHFPVDASLWEVNQLPWSDIKRVQFNQT